MAEKKRARPFVLGLTGSIAMGKTQTGKFFAELGIPVYSADQAVHALYDRGGLAVAPVAKLFPDAVREGRVDRARLAKHITEDAGALKRLEALVHPLVAKLRRQFLAEAEAKGADLVVVDIPLLFETGGEAVVDAVLVVTAPREIQRARVLARPGMTEEKLAVIEARQMSDAEKRAKADFIIDTGKGLEDAFESVKQLVAHLRAKTLHKN
jgi:dephospho-CoA kinase